MMGAAHVPTDVHRKVTIEALKCATQLNGLEAVTLGNKTATWDILMFNMNPDWSKNLHMWGKAGVVKEGKDGKT